MYCEELNSEELDRLEEYYQRTLYVKSEVLKNPQILTNVKNIFDYLAAAQNNTCDQMYNLVNPEIKCPKEVLFLGSGQIHRVYNIGSIPHPINSTNQLHIALKLRKIDTSYYICDDVDDEINDMMIEQISEYANVFCRQKLFLSSTNAMLMLLRLYTLSPFLSMNL